MKKFISALLVLCLVCSFIPMMGVSATDASGEKSGITVVYDWANQMGGKGDNKQINNDAAFLSQFTIDRSHNLWEYESAQTTWASTSWRQYGGKCIQFDRSGGNLWMAFEVYVPKTGWYTIEQNYAKISGSESDVDVFMFAKTGDFAIGNRNDGNKIFTLDCKGESSSITAAEPATADTYIEAGYYYVVYLQVGGGKAYFGNLTLNGGTGRAVTEIASVSAPTEVNIGDTGSVVTEVYYSDTTEGTAVAGDVVYTSSNANVLSVDEATGAYTAKAGGNATVTVTAGAISKSVEITVKKLEQSGIKVVYDWANQMSGKGDNKQINNDAAFLSQFTIDRSHNLWEYESAQTTWASTSWRQYGGKCIQFDRSGGNLWMAFEVYVPKTGWYTIEQNYAKISGTESDVDVFMFAKTGDFAVGNRNEGNRIFTLDCEGESSSITAAEPATADKYIEAGYYYVVYLQVGGGKAYFGNLTLNGGTGRAVTEIASVSAPTEVNVGDTGSVVTEVYYSDTTEGTAVAGDVVYKSSNTNVLSVDEATGAYTANGAGDAIITVAAGAVTKTVSVTVVSNEDPDVSNAFTTETPVATIYNPSVSGAGYNASGNSAIVDGITKTLQVNGSYKMYAPETSGDAQFLYWAKGLSLNKKIVSYENEFYYTPAGGENNILIAVYDDAESSANKAEFYNANGQLIKIITDASDDKTVPVLPSMAGYNNASAWKQYNGETEVAAGEDITPIGTMIFVAQYNSEDPIDVTVTVVNGNGTATVPYGTEIVCTPDDSKGTFKWWKKEVNGVSEIVSIDETYSFLAWEDCTVTAEYGTEKPTYTGNKMKIIIDSFTAGNAKAVMAEFIGFGADTVEKGIICNGTKIAMTRPGNQFTVTAEIGDILKGYAIVKNGIGYNLIVDGEVTLKDAE